MSKIRPLASILPNNLAKPDKPLKICVVTSEFLGPVKNGGIGAATSGLLEVLRKDGHDVTVLYTLVQHGNPECAERDWDHWVADMQEKGITLEFIDHPQDYRAWRLKSWLVMEHVGSGDYDLVFFNEHHGSGYYSISAKRAGLEPFADQTHCVITHGSIQWIFDINDQYMSRPSDLELMAMERRSAEWADVVIGPSRYILEKYDSFGWDLPAETFHQPLPLFHKPLDAVNRRRRKINEIVFFGRLETRKGLWVFCDALDRLRDRLGDTTVTFLGRTTTESGMSSGSLLMARSAGWPFKIRLISDFGQDKALSYLSGEGRLAVIPSLADNSPCVIYECMENDIPFVSTLGSGIQELVDENDRDNVLVAPNAVDLADKLHEALTDGAQMAAPAFDTRVNLSRWSAFATEIAERRSAARKSPRKPRASGVSVFLVDSCGSLPLLIRNLTSNHARIAGGKPLHLITSRGERIRKLVSEISGSTKNKISVLDAADTKAIQKAWCKKPYTVVCDSEIEIAPKFFEQLDRALAQSEMVSCVIAERDGLDSEAEIKSLPCGNLPGLPFLGYQIGSGLWAGVSRKISPLMENVNLVDPETDIPISAKELGQRLMLDGSHQGMAVQLMPLVGGIGTYPAPDQSAERRPHTVSARRAKLANIAPSVRLGGPAWLAVSAFASRHQQGEAHARVDSSTLMDTHPLNRIADGHIEYSNSAFAAALGRSQLAFELAACEWMDEEKSKNVLDLIIAANSERAPIDLLPCLMDAWQSGDADNLVERPSHRDRAVGPRLRELLESKGMSNEEREKVQDDGNAFTPDCIDTYLFGASVVPGERSYRLNPAKDGSLKMLFLEIPLGGRSNLEAELDTEGGQDVAVKFELIDQIYGSTISSRSVGSADAGTGVTMSLHGLHMNAMLLIECETPLTTALYLRKLRIV